MEIEIYRDRKVYTDDSRAGNINENAAEILEFTFPKKIVGYDIAELNKYIELDLGGQVKAFEIVDDKFTITSEITQYSTVKAQIAIIKASTLLWMSNIFYLHFGSSLESNIEINFTDLEIINTIKEQLQTLQASYEINLSEQAEYLERLEALEELSIDIVNTLNQIINAENGRIENENSRIEAEKLRDEAEKLRAEAENERNLAEQTRIENETKRVEDNKLYSSNEKNRQKAETERQESFDSKMQEVSDAISEIKDMTESYNQNATDKIKEFNENATQKTNEFNENVATQAKTFNDNTTEKLDTYNQNATSQTEAFNTNVQTKTENFNTNYEQKMTSINEASANIVQECEASNSKYARALKGKVEETNVASFRTENNKLEDLVIYGAELTQETSVATRNICPSKITDWESGTYDLMGNKIDNTSRIRLKEPMKVKSLTTLYFNTFTSNYVFVLRGYNSNNEFVKNLGIALNKAEVAIEDGIEYLGVSIYDNNNSNATFDDFVETFNSGTLKPFICLNSETDKTFVDCSYDKPSLDYSSEVIAKSQTLNVNEESISITLPENQFNGTIGSTKDCIKKVGDVWKLEKNISKYEFTGDEDWGWWTAGNNGLQNSTTAFINISDMKSTDFSDGYCSHFQVKKSKVLNTLRLGANNQTAYFYLDSNEFTNLDEWKAKLAELYQNSNPLYIVCIRSTPEYIELPQEIQDKLNNLEVLIGLNNISIDNGTFSFIFNKDLAYEMAKIEELEEDVDSIETTRGHIYGVRRKITDNSSSAWERLFDSINKTASATKNGGIVTNDFDNLAPWSEIKSCNYDLSTKKINAWFGDANFAFDGSNGDVFTHVSKTYWKIYQEDDYDYILLADYAKAGFTEIDGFFIGRYNGSVVSDDGLLHTYSGLVPTTNKTIGAFRNLANALGDNFSQLDWRYFVLQMLYLVEYASFNSQSMLGNGVMNRKYLKTLVAESNTNRVVIGSSSGYYVGQIIRIGTSDGGTQVADARKITAIEAYDDGTVTGYSITFDGTAVDIAVDNYVCTMAQETGQCDSLGMKSGCINNDGYHSMVYRGVENLFANVWQWVDGINIKDYIAYICKDHSQYASDVFADPYKPLAYTNASTNGWTKTLGYDPDEPFFRFTTEVGGSSSTYMDDYYYQNSGNRVALVGDLFYNGANDGLWSWSFGNASSDANWHFGCRVLIDNQ